MSLNLRNRSLLTVQDFTQRGFRYPPDRACDPKRTNYACRCAAMMLAILALSVTVLLPCTALPQSTEGTPVVIDPAAGTMPEPGPEIEPGEGTARRTGRSVTPLVAPVPFKNTQLGWGLMLMGGLIHRFDADTTIKPSTGVVRSEERRVGKEC